MPNRPGSRRKPTAILKLNGAIDSRPGRYPNAALEPVPEGEIGKAPTVLSKDEKKIWNEIVKQSPSGVLTNNDRLALEMVCRLMAKVRGGTAKATEMCLLNQMLQQLGMTPVARSRVVVEKKDRSKSEWAALLTPNDDAHAESSAIH